MGLDKKKREWLVQQLHNRSVTPENLPAWIRSSCEQGDELQVRFAYSRGKQVIFIENRRTKFGIYVNEEKSAPTGGE